MAFVPFYRQGLEKSRNLSKVLEEDVVPQAGVFLFLALSIHVMSQRCLSLQVQILSLEERTQQPQSAFDFLTLLSGT